MSENELRALDARISRLEVEIRDVRAVLRNLELRREEAEREARTAATEVTVREPAVLTTPPAPPVPPPPVIAPAPSLVFGPPEMPHKPEPLPEPVARPQPAAPAARPSAPWSPVAPPKPQAAPAAHAEAPAPGIDWESLIGGRWALWLGMVAVFLSVAFFLAYTWNKMPEIARIGVGFGFGMAFLVAGEFFRERLDRTFSAGLTGGGLAILYLDIWAAANRYNLLNFDLALMLMVLVSALGVYLAVRYDAISLSALATLGGFLTPVLLSSDGGGSGSAVPFLTYVAVLNAGILAVSIFKEWRSIVWLSFVATLLLVSGWAVDQPLDPIRWTLFTFTSLYFAMFLGAACFRSLLNNEETAQEDLVLFFADATAYALAGAGLIGGMMGGFPAAFPLGVAIWFGLLAAAVSMLAPNNRLLRDSATGLGLLFITIAVPVQLRQGWIGVAWAVEAAVLLTLAVRSRSDLFRVASHIILILSGLSVLVAAISGTPGLPLFFNERALPVLFFAAATAWMAGVTRGRTREDGFYTAYPVLAVSGFAWLLAQETTLAAHMGLMPWATSVPGGALYAVAIVLGPYSLAAYAIGLKARSLFIRFSALAVAAIGACLPVLAVGNGLGGHAFWNVRGLAYAVTAATIGALGWLAAGEREDLEDQESTVLGWASLAMHIVILWAVSLEILVSYGVDGLTVFSPVRSLMAAATFWSAYTAVLLIFGWSWKRSDWRGLAYTVQALAAVFLVIGSLATWSDAWRPFINMRFLAFMAGAASFVVATAYSRKDADLLESEDAVRSAYGLVAAMLALWGMTQDTFTLGVSGAWPWVQSAPGGPTFLVAIVWSLFALGLFTIGRQYRRILIRFAASAVAAGGAGLCVMATEAEGVSGSPFWNIRWLAFVLATASLVLITWWTGHEEGADETESSVAGWISVGIHVLVVFAISAEMLAVMAGRGAGLTLTDPAARLSLATFWSLYAGMLVASGWAYSRPAWRSLAYILGGGAILVLLDAALDVGSIGITPLWNARFLAFAAATGALVVAANYSAGREEPDGSERDLRCWSGMLAVVVALWGLTQETYSTVYHFQDVFGAGWERAAQVAISLLWAVSAVALLIGGVMRQHRPIRLFALGLSGATAIKVFVFDVGAQDLPYRVLAFGGLGIALIGISWLYTRYGVGREVSSA